MNGKDDVKWIGDSNYYIEGNTLHISAAGDVDDTVASAVREAALDVMQRSDEKVNCVIDLNKAGKQSAKARQVYRELGEHPKAGKIALFGMHPVARVLAAFVIGLIQTQNVRFFKTQEEALAWLKAKEK